MKVIILIALILSLGCSAEVDEDAETCERLRVSYIELMQMYNSEVIRKQVPELVPNMLSLLEEHMLTYAEYCYMTGPLPPLYIHTGHTI